jgi:hypothetical protein
MDFGVKKNKKKRKTIELCEEKTISYILVGGRDSKKERKEVKEGGAKK